MRRSDIHIRDPFVLPVVSEGTYYLFGTRGSTVSPGSAPGFDCYSSADLVTWTGPTPAFRAPEGFWATRDYWVPEVHPHGGRYYMLASFKAPDACRGTQVLASDSPAGPFVPHSEGPVTPRDWECLDGTLFVDDAGDPWMVFCHEWLQVHDGEMCAIRLSTDLSEAVSDPVLLFRASEAAWVRSVRPGQQEYVTDGPFLHRLPGGDLVMLWSSFGEKGYGLTIARSRSGHITGPWAQDAEPLYETDGGHGMLFRTFEGELMLSLHAPNRGPDERPHFIPIHESNDVLEILSDGGVR